MKRSECLGLLGELKLTTASNAAADVEAQIRIYAQKLENYPADIVRNCLKSQSQKSKWWPTWFDLQEQLDVDTKERKLIAKGLGLKL